MNFLASLTALLTGPFNALTAAGSITAKGSLRQVSLLVMGLIWGVTTSAATPHMIPAPPNLAATSWLLVDARTGTVIVEHNADEPKPPASLTKMMTAYIASEQIASGNISLDDEVLISEKAWRKGGSKMYIRVGTRVKLEDLLRGIIIQSGNDASIAVAEHIAGSEEAFADLMTQQALALGMNHTRYQNATGWPAKEHYTTARDLSKLARAIIYHHPLEYQMYSEKEFTYNKIRQPNRNMLLWRDSSVDGIKTGHTQEAGYCLVSSAQRGDMRLIAVVLGTKSENSRATESMKLLTYGFRFFETIRSYSSETELVATDIWLGQKDKIRLGVDQEVLMTIPRGSNKNIKAHLDFDKNIKAPISKGENVGSVKLMLDEELLKEIPLVALETVEEAGFLKRLWQQIVLFVLGLFK